MLIAKGARIARNTVVEKLALVRGLEMRIVYVQAHVEAFADVPLGARTELIEREVWATAVVLAVVHIDRRPNGAFDRDIARNAEL